MGRATAGPVSAPFERSRSTASDAQAWLFQFGSQLPRPLRFLAVGGIGLAAELLLFTLMLLAGLASLVAGFAALVAATVVTWRLNRAFTFDSSGRVPSHEALRYGLVTAVAQSTSYVVFAALVSGVLALLPQAALIVGAACGAVVSYNGHRLFAFAPVKSCADLPRC